MDCKIQETVGRKKMPRWTWGGLSQEPENQSPPVRSRPAPYSYNQEPEQEKSWEPAEEIQEEVQAVEEGNRNKSWSNEDDSETTTDESWTDEEYYEESGETDSPYEETASPDWEEEDSRAYDEEAADESAFIPDEGDDTFARDGGQDEEEIQEEPRGETGAEIRDEESVTTGEMENEEEIPEGAKNTEHDDSAPKSGYGPVWRRKRPGESPEYAGMRAPAGAPLERLKEVRLSWNCTQRMVANYLGVSHQYYSGMERGVNSLRAEYAIMIARFFNLSCDDLFSEDLGLPPKPDKPNRKPEKKQEKSERKSKQKKRKKKRQG